MPPPKLGENGERTHNQPSGSGMLLQQTPRKPSSRVIPSNLEIHYKRNGDHGESYQRTYDKSSQKPVQSAMADPATAFRK